MDKTYIVPPNSDERDTLIRITAIRNSSLTFMIDSVVKTLTLYKFDYFDTRITSSQLCIIESASPVSVTAFGLGSNNSSIGDPSMTIVPGINQNLDYYRLVVPSGYDRNYVSIMIKDRS